MLLAPLNVDPLIYEVGPVVPIVLVVPVFPVVPAIPIAPDVAMVPVPEDPDVPEVPDGADTPVVPDGPDVPDAAREPPNGVVIVASVCLDGGAGGAGGPLAVGAPA